MHSYVQLISRHPAAVLSVTTLLSPSAQMCRYCANFTLTQLRSLFDNKLINFVELDVIPWGNARLDDTTGQVTCQHGPLECELNRLISCALAQHPIQVCACCMPRGCDVVTARRRCQHFLLRPGSEVALSLDDVATTCKKNAGISCRLTHQACMAVCGACCPHTSAIPATHMLSAHSKTA